MLGQCGRSRNRRGLDRRRAWAAALLVSRSVAQQGAVASPVHLAGVQSLLAFPEAFSRARYVVRSLAHARAQAVALSGHGRRHRRAHEHHEPAQWSGASICSVTVVLFVSARSGNVLSFPVQYIQSIQSMWARICSLGTDVRQTHARFKTSAWRFDDALRIQVSQTPSGYEDGVVRVINALITVRRSFILTFEFLFELNLLSCCALCRRCGLLLLFVTPRSHCQLLGLLRSLLPACIGARSHSLPLALIALTLLCLRICLLSYRPCPSTTHRESATS